jgi:hypothetical protein
MRGGSALDYAGGAILTVALLTLGWTAHRSARQRARIEITSDGLLVRRVFPRKFKWSEIDIRADELLLRRDNRMVRMRLRRVLAHPEAEAEVLATMRDAKRRYAREQAMRRYAESTGKTIA